jgi:hypothetical protein
MYDTLIMLKPDATFSLEDMESILRDVAESGEGLVERQGTSIFLRSSDSYLQIDFNNEPFVIEESKEIAADRDIACGECAARFEMASDDPDMELFNDYLLVNERLDETGNFLIFDQAEGNLFGE